MLPNESDIFKVIEEQMEGISRNEIQMARKLDCGIAAGVRMRSKFNNGCVEASIVASLIQFNLEKIDW